MPGIFIDLLICLIADGIYAPLLSYDEEAKQNETPVSSLSTIRIIIYIIIT